MGMMINRRRVCGGKSLPYDAEIEYLESTGTQYIDTGIYLGAANSTFAIRRDINISFMFTKSITQNSEIIGCYSSKKGTPRVQFLIDRTSKFTTSSISITDGVTARDSMVVNNKYNVALYNTNTYNHALLSLTLFALNGDSGDILYKTNGMRLYSCFIKTNNETILDFIPVRIGQIGYMYDKVSGQLFANAGTGDFILGPDK